MSGKKINIGISGQQDDLLSKIGFKETIKTTKLRYDQWTIDDIYYDNSFFDTEKSFNYLNSIVQVQYESKKELPRIIAQNEDDIVFKENKSLNINTGHYYIANFDFKYNFLIKKYEDNIKNINEKDLPSIYNFFKETSNINYKNIINNDIFENISFSTNNDRNIIFDSHIETTTGQQEPIKDFFKKSNGYKFLFPFFVDISWKNNTENTFFNDLFTKHKLYNKILTHVKNSLTASQYVNLDNWILQNNSEIQNSNEFRFKINDIVNNVSLTLQDIKENKKTYSEVIAYKITKRQELSPSSGNIPRVIALPQQEWYIPNTKESIMNFIDTQVKYDKRYNYKISLIVLCVGVNYKIKKIEEDLKKLLFSTSNFINIYSIDGPEYTGVIYDSPPLPPQVDLIPSAENSRKIKIFLNTSLGKTKDRLITFSEKEEKVKQKIFLAQDLFTDFEDPKIHFQSDEPNRLFEIYRIDYSPNNYIEFLSGKAKKIIVNTDGASSSSYIEEELQLNKKYYYIFRAVDNHDNFSNPTKVLTVEIVNNSGTIYHLFGTHDLNSDPINLRETTKKFKKSIFFHPSMGHLVFSDSERRQSRDSALSTIGIGEANPTVWGKKFKIRITSLSTGKKIDLNVKFDVNKG